MSDSELKQVYLFVVNDALWHISVVYERKRYKDRTVSEMKIQAFETISNIKNTQKTLPEQVSDQIRNLIIEQHMEIGARLPNEFELAQQLNVGRGTVREAVKLLVARNVLEIQRGKGTFVASNTGHVDDPLGFAYMDNENQLAKELYDLRLQLEPWIAELAAEYATESDIAELRKRQQEVEDMIRAEKNYLPADQQFHICIADCTRNRVLPKLIPVITYSVHLFGKMNKVRLAQETIETHKAIADAIEQHNGSAARAAMMRHLKLNQQTVPALSEE